MVRLTGERGLPWWRRLDAVTGLGRGPPVLLPPFFFCFRAPVYAGIRTVTGSGWISIADERVAGVAGWQMAGDCVGVRDLVSGALALSFLGDFFFLFLLGFFYSACNGVRQRGRVCPHRLPLDPRRGHRLCLSRQCRRTLAGLPVWVW